MYIEHFRKDYINSGIVTEIVQGIMDTELNKSQKNMRPDVVDVCLDILNEIEKYINNKC